jgi:adenosylcobinamide-GDP ribazoletransferase
MVIAFSMYSKLPMPRVEWNEKNMKHAMCFFPLVGAAAGICVWLAGTFFLDTSVGKTFGTVFFSAVMTLLPLGITGGIHMDGFLDTVDALSSWGDREKKLEILKDSHSGAFAVIGTGAYLLWNAALWSEMRIENLPVVCCGYVLSRSFSGYSVAAFPPAREGGLARTFHDGADQRRTKVVMVAWMVLSIAGMIACDVIIGGITAACAAIVFLYYRRMCRVKFGGITGDLAGYFLQVCELVMLTAVVLAGHFL